jgi:NAD(P) transhydrogenase
LDPERAASERYDLVAIGTGPAGQRAAVQAAKLGRKVAVVEKRRVVGGVCLDTGTIPSKTFREAVLAYVSHRRPDDDEPPSVADLLARVSAVSRRSRG